MQNEEPTGFCVVCGKEGVKLYGALCGECLARKVPPASIPERIALTVCPFCGARQRGRHWESGPPPGFFHGRDLDPFLTVNQPFILKETAWEESGQNPAIRIFSGNAALRIGNVSVSVPLKTEMKVISHTCPACSRKGGKYYTAKIQLRQSEETSVARSAQEFRDAARRIWDDFLMESRREWRESIGWDEELREGIDIFVTDTSTAKSMARALKTKVGATVKESASLWGVKDGRRTYRTTLLLRFPSLLLGDFFEKAGTLWQVDRLDREDVRMIDVVTGQQESFEMTEFIEGSRLVGGSDRLVDTILDEAEPDSVADVRTGEKHSLIGSGPGRYPSGDCVPAVLDGEKAWWAPMARGRQRQRSA